MPRKVLQRNTNTNIPSLFYSFSYTNVVCAFFIDVAAQLFIYSLPSILIFSSISNYALKGEQGIGLISILS